MVDYCECFKCEFVKLLNRRFAANRVYDYCECRFKNYPLVDVTLKNHFINRICDENPRATCKKVLLDNLEKL